MWTRLEQQKQTESRAREANQQPGADKENPQDTNNADDDSAADEENHDNKLPDWLENYIVYKFNLYDRTGTLRFGCQRRLRFPTHLFNLELVCPVVYKVDRGCCEDSIAVALFEFGPLQDHKEQNTETQLVSAFL